jgi:hypothetical protein
MSSLDPNSATANGSSFLPDPQNTSASNTASVSLTTNKEQIEPRALCLLRDFFLLLEQWEQQQEP